jgi:hypothetical protein
VIERAEREDAERRAAARERTRHGAHGAVAAGGNDDRRSAPDRVGGFPCERRAFREPNVNVRAGVAKRICDLPCRRCILFACACVEEDGDPLIIRRHGEAHTSASRRSRHEDGETTNGGASKAHIPPARCKSRYARFQGPDVRADPHRGADRASAR